MIFRIVSNGLCRNKTQNEKRYLSNRDFAEPQAWDRVGRYLAFAKA